jgi:small neutral amino acid transporter SnatA (MarC family)
MRAFLAFLAAVNPPAVALALRPPESRRLMAAAVLIAAGAAVALAAASESVLDALDVSDGTFRVAAGVVLGIAALRWLVGGARPVIVEEATGAARIAVPLLIPVLFTPQLVMTSISAGVDHGTAVVAGAAALALALAWLAGTQKGPPVVWTVATQFFGALGVAVALSLIVDGVQTI